MALAELDAKIYEIRRREDLSIGVY
jgi:hypothetical protein